MTCKAAITFFQYSVLANFYWLLVEGLYLQTLLLLTFTCDRSYTWGYILIGWGEPGGIPDIPAHPWAGTTWEWPDLRPTWPEVPSQRSPGLLPSCPNPNISCMALVGTHLLLLDPRAAGEAWPDPGQVLPSSHTHPMDWEHPSQVPGCDVRAQGQKGGQEVTQIWHHQWAPSPSPGEGEKVVTFLPYPELS